MTTPITEKNNCCVTFQEVKLHVVAIIIGVVGVLIGAGQTPSSIIMMSVGFGINVLLIISRVIIHLRTKEPPPPPPPGGPAFD